MHSMSSGEKMWIYEPSAASGSYNPLTVNPKTGDIYFGTTTAGQFYCVNASGNLKWKFDGAGSMKSAAPAVNKDGSVVYVGDNTGNIFALDATSGAKKWQAALGSATAGLLVNGNELVAGATDDRDILQHGRRNSHFFTQIRMHDRHHRFRCRK